MPQPIVNLPRGSILYIEAKDLLATPAGTVKTWNKVTEHNRSAFEIRTERIEKVVRTSNGTLRKNHIADKKKFQLSWDMLPSYRTLTVDGGWGAEDLRSFYLGDEGKQSFNIRVNLAKTGSDQSTSGYEAYTVVFSSCDFTVVKRGLQPHWSVSLSLDEV
jgi:hypothetical protein